jgi:type I restriction enzyme R subunit
VGAGYSPWLVDEKEDYDLDDVLPELGWGMRPRTRQDRTLAFTYKHEEWLDALPAVAAATVKAITRQFERGGTESLENPQVFQTPEAKAAGGLAALQAAGQPAELLRETKARMFAA